jgi:hypothetical protein
MPAHIDTCSYDDYDKVVKFLLENKVPIVSRDKMKLVVVAELTKELADKMQDEIDFEEFVSIGETSLG